MGKKIQKDDFTTPAQRELGNLTVKGLKRACIIRGLDFHDAINFDCNRLQSWFIHHYYDDIDNSNLDKFDEYMEDELRDIGQEELIHPQLRLGYVGERDEEGNVTKTKKIKGLKRIMKKRKEKNTLGIFSGTKKALTFELALKGVSKESTIKQVMKVFPEAKEKSINIWYNSAKKKFAKK